MRTEWRFERRITIPASATEVSARVVTPEGINDEMRPWMTMTVPRGAEGTTIDNLEVGKPIGRAWLRLFGLVPYEYDCLTIAELEPGRRFRAEPMMMSMRRWVHDRTVQPIDDQRAEVIDRITIGPRRHLLLIGPVLLRVMHAYFGHRHRRLVRHFSTN